MKFTGAIHQDLKLKNNMFTTIITTIEISIAPAPIGYTHPCGFVSSGGIFLYDKPIN